MKIVSLMGPAPCGAYQVHLDLLRELSKRDCSLTWLSSGIASAAVYRSGGFEPSPGEVVAPHSSDMKERTSALMERLKTIAPDILLCHAIGDKIDFNAIRYFPRSMPKILLLHSTTVAHYRAARAVRDYVNATVAISRRIKQDLATSYGFGDRRIELISNGVDLEAYLPRSAESRPSGSVRILVHGRINHAAKGVLWVPRMLKRLLRFTDRWECTISGDGEDLAKLRERVTTMGLDDRVRFTGWTAAQAVPALMNQHDVFLLPSKYEGYPIALVEAMAGGCVPVASRLPGVTDRIVQNGVDGLLFSPGDIQAAAQMLAGLILHRGRLLTLSQRAQESARQYGLDSMGDHYYRLFSEVVASPAMTLAPEPLDHCVLAHDLQPAWWNRLPSPLKDRLRVVREKVRTVLPVP